MVRDRFQPAIEALRALGMKGLNIPENLDQGLLEDVVRVEPAESIGGQLLPEMTRERLIIPIQESG
jgi:hypothetical protein